MIGLGTLIDVGAILLGGIAGLALRNPLSVASQQRLQKLIAYGCYIVLVILLWSTFRQADGFLGFMKAGFIVFLSLIFGNFMGKKIGIQKQFTKLGQHAQNRMNVAQKTGKKNFNDGFITCALLFCVSPMALFGSLQDGLTGDYKILILKAAVDGLSMMAFVRIFGGGSILSVIPVAAYQGTITLLAIWTTKQDAMTPEIVASITATNGMLVMCLPLIILNIGKKFPINDWLPALVIAPFITWLW